MRAHQAAWTKLAAVILVSATLCAGTSLFPNAVKAYSISVQTRQLLPFTGNSCRPLGVSAFTPYVYEGGLHSFSFAVSDDSYVAISGTVGEYTVPFYQTTRWRDPSGSLRVHVDIPTTRIGNGLLLSVTLLSSGGPSQPVCVSVVTMSIGQTAVPSPATGAAPSTPTPSTGSQGGAAPRPSVPSGGETPGGRTPEATTSVPTTTTGTSSAVASIQDRLLEQCAAGGAFRLWIVLLVVYALIVLTAVFGKLPSPQIYSRGQRVATILVPFALLLGFWYFVETCRATVWMPVTALVLTLLGMIGVYRDDSRVTPYMKPFSSSGTEYKKEPSSKKDTVIITPPPQQKSPEKPKL